MVDKRSWKLLISSAFLCYQDESTVKGIEGERSGGRGGKGGRGERRGGRRGGGGGGRRDGEGGLGGGQLLHAISFVSSLEVFVYSTLVSIQPKVHKALSSIKNKFLDSSNEKIS